MRRWRALTNLPLAARWSPRKWDVAETNSAKVASASPSYAEGFSLAGAAYDPVGHSLGRPEDYPFRVLLTIPEATTIPICALGLEAQRKEVERKLMSSTREALARVLSGNTSRALEGRYGDHRLLNIRRRVDWRMAIYSLWLALTDQTAAEALVNDHPGATISAD